MPPREKKNLPVVLSIAGYDPSSGAGVTADVKTIAAHGCYAITCITALTVQSTRGVKRVEMVDSRIITETLEELITDFKVAAVRIGMLGSAEAVRTVAAFLRRNQPGNVVLDPVLKSSSGADLISREGAQVMKEKLLPLVDVITPNIDEAATFTGLTVHNVEEMQIAAAQLHKLGARNVIVTGGHLSPPTDLLSRSSGNDVKFFQGEKVSSSHTHGTGCAFASALACNLAHEQSLPDATRDAKQYVFNALKNAVPLGKGRGPINHLYRR